MNTSIMSQRYEFVLLAQQRGVCFQALCRRFGVSRKTGYKWKRRFVASGRAGLADRSRRPHGSPRLSSRQVTADVLALRQANPAWGGRKLRRRLQDLKQAAPSASTCTAILRRADLLVKDRPAVRPWQRFQRAQPNELWQMDFKGHFATQAGPRCHPLTVLDDHSRFNLVLAASADQTGRTVREALLPAFRTYGLPEAILCDNGAPWGQGDPVCPYTSLTIWLMQLGVRVLHGRPYHPQTQGKDERFHRTLHLELLSRHTWSDLAHCAQEFPRYRLRYNCERPHDALGGDTPVIHYQPSPRSLPPHLPQIEYPANYLIKIVPAAGDFVFKGQSWYIGRAFAELPVGLRPSPLADGQWEVFFSHHLIGQINLSGPPSPKHTHHSIYPQNPT